MDTYKDFEDAKKAYNPYVACADIIKFSDDELKLYTGIDDIKTAIESIYKEGQLFVLTLGSKGNFYLPFVAEGKFTVSTETNATLIECLPSKQD